MIKFFRQIRHRLFLKGKIGQYLKYAIGEIVLVVMGILIALQVNRWNNDEIDKSTACRYIENILVDLNTDLVKLSGLNALNTFYEEQGFYLIDFFENKLEVIDTNRLKQSLVYSSYCPAYNKSSSTYNELIYSGELKLFKDNDLKRVMDDYYISNLWSENFDERIRHTMWYDYQDELLTTVDPLIFRTMYEIPYLVPRILQNGEHEKVSELNDFYVDWEAVRQNLKLISHLKRIQAHRVQLKISFNSDINKIEELIRRLQEARCATID